MKPLPNSPRSSMQRLRGVLQQALLDGFQSKLGQDFAALSEEIVNAILFEIEGWLVEFSSETIDQVAGRLETRLRELEKSRSGGSSILKSVSSAAGQVAGTVYNLLFKSSSEDAEFIDAVCKVLNGIGKEERLDDLRRYLADKSENPESGKSSGQSGDDKLIRDMLIQKIGRKVQKNIGRFFKIQTKVLGSCVKISARLTKTINRNTRLANRNFAAIDANNKLAEAAEKIISVRKKLYKDNLSEAGKRIRKSLSYVMDAAKTVVQAVKLVLNGIFNIIQSIQVIVQSVLAVVQIVIAVLQFSLQIIVSVITNAVMLLIYTVQILFFSVLFLLVSVLIAAAAIAAGVVFLATTLLSIVVFPAMALVYSVVLFAQSIGVAAAVLPMFFPLIAPLIAIGLAFAVFILVEAGLVFGLAVALDHMMGMFATGASFYAAGALLSVAILQAGIAYAAALYVAIVAGASSLVAAELTALVLGFGILAAIFAFIAMIVIDLTHGIIMKKFSEFFGISDDENGREFSALGYIRDKCPNWIQDLWDNIEKKGGLVGWLNGFVTENPGGDDSFFGTAISLLKQVAENIKKFKKYFDKFKESTAFKKIKEYTGKIFNELLPKLRKFYKDFKDCLNPVRFQQKIIAKTKELANKATAKTKELAKKTVEKTKNIAKQAVSATKNAAKSLWSGVKSVFKRTPMPGEGGATTGDIAKAVETLSNGKVAAPVKTKQIASVQEMATPEYQLAKNIDDKIKWEMEFCRTYGIPYESYVAAAEHGKLREFLQNHFLYLSFLAKQKEKGVDVHGMSKDFVMELLSNNPDVIKPAALAAADDKPVFDASKAMPWLYPPQKEKTPEEVEQEREAELKKFCTENDVNLEDYKNAEKNGNLLQFLMSSLSGFAEVAVATEVARTDATAREQYNATGFGVKPKYDNIRFQDTPILRDPWGQNVVNPKEQNFYYGNYMSQIVNKRRAHLEFMAKNDPNQPKVNSKQLWNEFRKQNQ